MNRHQSARGSMPIGNQRPRAIEVKIADTEELTCEQCGAAAWQDAVRIFRVSRLLAGTPTDIFARANTVVCAKCGARKDDETPLQVLHITL